MMESRAQRITFGSSSLKSFDISIRSKLSMCRHDHQKLTLQVALTMQMNGMDKCMIIDNDHILLFRGLSPIPIFCCKLQYISCCIELQFLWVRPYRTLNSVRIFLTLRDEMYRNCTIKTNHRMMAASAGVLIIEGMVFLAESALI